MTEKQFAEFERRGAIPGHFQRVRPMALSQQKILERPIGQYPAGVAQAEAQATADLTAISGINEALMGVDIPSGSSGRAIELKTKQAITHLAIMFDNLRAAKKKIANLLWGRRGHAGVVPQFYTADKVYRVEGVNGQQFIRVNQQVVEQDPIAGVVVHTLNDLSHGEFDIVIADVEASTTQRQAQMWGLVDAVSRLGVPGDLVFDIILDLSDIPQKEEIKQRWQQRQESQAKAAQDEMQLKLQLEEIKNQDSRQIINFRDSIENVLKLCNNLRANFKEIIRQGVNFRNYGHDAIKLFEYISDLERAELFFGKELTNMLPIRAVIHRIRRAVHDDEQRINYSDGEILAVVNAGLRIIFNPKS